MPKHKKQPKSVRIIKKAGTPNQGEAVIPPIPEPEQPDAVELQLMNQISQLKKMHSIKSLASKHLCLKQLLEN